MPAIAVGIEVVERVFAHSQAEALIVDRVVFIWAELVASVDIPRNLVGPCQGRDAD